MGIKIKTSDNFDIGIIPIEKFIQSVSGFDLVDALLFVQKVNADIKNFICRKVYILSPSVPHYLDNWFLITTEANAFIAKYLIRFSLEVNYKKYDAHCHSNNVIYYHHLETDLHYLNSKDPQAYKWCIRAMNQQFHYLRLPYHIAGRYLILLNKIKIGEVDTISNMFAKEFGLTPHDIMFIGICMYAVILQNKIFDLNNLINFIDSPIAKSVLTEEKLNKFLDIYSIDIEGFKDEFLKWKAPTLITPLFKYEFNPLWSYPIIRTKRILEPEKKYIVPSLVDLLYACSEGIYYKLMDKFKTSKGNLFSEKFGKVFQEYVGYLLRGANIVYESCDTKDSGNNPRPDYLKKGNNKVIQIEVKKRVMSNEARACVGDELEVYVDKLVDDIYRQLFKPSRYYPGYRVHNVIVAMDEWYYFEEKIKPIIEDKLNGKRKEDGISEFKFHLLGCTDFEILCQFVKEKKEADIFDLLCEKEEGPIYYYKGLSRVLSEKYDYNPIEVSFAEAEFDNLLDSVLGK